MAKTLSKGNLMSETGARNHKKKKKAPFNCVDLKLKACLMNDSRLMTGNVSVGRCVREVQPDGAGAASEHRDKDRKSTVQLLV